MSPPAETLSPFLSEPETSDLVGIHQAQYRLPHEGPTTVFHITGFARFFNVPVNPTELIVHGLPQYLERCPLKPNAQLASATVLQVSAKTVLEQLNSMYAQVRLGPSKGVKPQTGIRSNYQGGLLRTKRRTVFIHLGVNMRCTRFNLEWKARNEATFSCPDESGWVPLRHAIDPDNGDITCSRHTSIPLVPLVDKLSEQGHSVSISSDAGRFVCNWTYFNSLKLAHVHDAHALFVHVPPASLVPIERQVKFLADLLDSIAQIQIL